MANKAPRTRERHLPEPWFTKRVEKNRAKAKAAKKARKRQR
jgi:hypothetical protein